MLEKRPFSPGGRGLVGVSPLGVAGSYGIDADGVERAFHELGVNYFFITSKNDGVLEGLKRLIKKGGTSRKSTRHRRRRERADGIRRARGDRKRFEAPRHRLHRRLPNFLGAVPLVRDGQHMARDAKLKEGRAKTLGVSIHDRKMARVLVDELRLDMMMIRYNAAHRGAETEIFATLPEKRPAIVAYTATRWGRLLQSAGDRGPMTPEECYRFALTNPNVDLVLCGPKNYAELEQNARGVALGPLPKERIDEVRAFGDVVRKGVSSIAYGGA